MDLGKCFCVSMYFSVRRIRQSWGITKKFLENDTQVSESKTSVVSRSHLIFDVAASISVSPRNL